MKRRGLSFVSLVVAGCLIASCFPVSAACQTFPKDLSLFNESAFSPRATFQTAFSRLRDHFDVRVHVIKTIALLDPYTVESVHVHQMSAAERLLRHSTFSLLYLFNLPSMNRFLSLDNALSMPDDVSFVILMVNGNEVSHATAIYADPDLLKPESMPTGIRRRLADESRIYLTVPNSAMAQPFICVTTMRGRRIYKRLGMSPEDVIGYMPNEKALYRDITDDDLVIAQVDSRPNGRFSIRGIDWKTASLLGQPVEFYSAIHLAHFADEFRSGLAVSIPPSIRRRFLGRVPEEGTFSRITHPIAVDDAAAQQQMNQRESEWQIIFSILYAASWLAIQPIRRINHYVIKQHPVVRHALGMRPRLNFPTRFHRISS